MLQWTMQATMKVTPRRLKALLAAFNNARPYRWLGREWQITSLMLECDKTARVTLVRGGLNQRVHATVTIH